MSIEFFVKALTGRVLFCKVTAPEAEVSNFARRKVNFKSWVGDGTHAVLFELLKRTPT